MPASAPSRGPGRTAATSLPAILDAAMAVIRAEGLAALTMRRLADELGVWTRTLYHHVGADKDRLVTLVVDAIAATIDRPPPDVAWDERLRRLLHGMYDALCEYPGIAEYLHEQGVPGPNGIALGEAVALAVHDAGLDAVEAARVSYLLQSMAFADSHHHPAPTNAAKAICAQRTREQRHQHELALVPDGAPRSTEQYGEMAEWPPGEHLDWVIDMAIAHIRARTEPAGRSPDLAPAPSTRGRAVLESS